MTVDVNITGLADTGTELGSFMSNIGPGLANFLLVIGVAGAVVSLIVAIVYWVKKSAGNAFQS